MCNLHAKGIHLLTNRRSTDRVARRLVKHKWLEDAIKVTPGDDWKNVNLMHTNIAQTSYG